MIRHPMGHRFWTLLSRLTEKLMQETEKNDFPKRTRPVTLLRHWKIGLLAVCLLAGV
jgi:hypothetical protein